LWGISLWVAVVRRPRHSTRRIRGGYRQMRSRNESCIETTATESMASIFIVVEIICQGRWTPVAMTALPCIHDPRRRSSTKVGSICFHWESAVRCVYSCAICRDHKSGLRRRLLKTGIAFSQFSRHLPADSCHSRATATLMGGVEVVA
jgi:hypothetical protein